MNTTIQCTQCYNGDIEEVGRIKGYFKTLELYKGLFECTSCGFRPKEEWVVTKQPTAYDRVCELLPKIEHLPRVADDVRTRCTDFLSSNNDENAPYIQQQLRFLNNVISSLPRHI